MMNRRQFLKWTGVAGMGLALRPVFAWAYGQSPLLRKFIQPLPGLGPTGIPLATVDRRTYDGVDFYDLEAAQFRHQFHPDLPPSTLWGYADRDGVHGYLGGVIVARKGTPVRLRMTNKLPSRHPLPVDQSLPGADGGAAENRIAVHLHGGHVPWNSDGGPFAWFDPGLGTGASFANPALDRYRNRIPGAADYWYPNDQSARFMWYHDHAMGITRLNAYAGLASAYLLRDGFELELVNSRVLPSREIPLIIQDKSFVDARALAAGYPRGGLGDLWYPYLYEESSAPDGTGRWDYGRDQQPPATVAGPLPVPSCVPEFFGDTSIVNGAAYPFAELEPRHYRLRILNGSQARFLNLQLYLADATGGEVALDAGGTPVAAVPFLQIGTEGGFLPRPVLVPSQPLAFDPLSGNPTRHGLLLAPAERADVIVDLRAAPVGSRWILYSDAPAPFPGGDPRNDYFTGDADQSAIGGAPATQPGFGPNSRTLMQIRIVPLVGSPDPASLHALYAARPGQLPGIPALDPAKAAVTRNLTLNEDFDDLGRLIQRLGTDVSIAASTQGLPTFARNYMDAATETPRAGSVEVWNVFNLTGDTHPIHFHLVNVQVLGRAPFAVDGAGKPVLPATLNAPDANELGWKETVRMNPGEVTTVIARFDLARVPFRVPPSPRTGGNEFVWHCHILEHEEHDMMRPLVVV